MPLLKLFEADKDAVLELPIETIVKMAGGRLLDGNASSKEFRSFLGRIESEDLLNYAQQCLDKDSKFSDNGLALQDIVNEIGHRLGFRVESGRYRGKANENDIGHDGIWHNDGKIADILIEVKMAVDSFTVSLKKIAAYRRDLIDKEAISEDTSLLIVVGRGDTSSLEDQIRGSDYADKARLISVESLSNLLRITEKSKEDATMYQIQEILQPFEYIKIDKIIDVIFTTAEDVEAQDDIQGDVFDDQQNDASDTDEKYTPSPKGKRRVENEKREMAINALEKKIFEENNLKVSLLQKRQVLFQSEDGKYRACVCVSKFYGDRNNVNYWYAYRGNYEEFLKGGANSYLILVCEGKDECFIMPHSFVGENLESLNQTHTGTKTHWHILLKNPKAGEKDGVVWNMSKINKKEPMSEFAVPMITKLDKSS